VILAEEEKTFSIEVGDEVPASGAGSTASAGSGVGADGGDAEGEDEMGLAVISGLVDDVEVSTTEDGGVIRMSWPTASVVTAR
jgi:hypothetical protein